MISNLISYPCASSNLSMCSLLSCRLSKKHVLCRGITDNSFQAPGPGWLQFDDGVELNAEGLVVSIGGKPLDQDRLYRVGSFIDFDTDYGTPSIQEYFKVWLAFYSTHLSQLNW